jgi:hypothetical protein
MSPEPKAPTNAVSVTHACAGVFNAHVHRDGHLTWRRRRGQIVRLCPWCDERLPKTISEVLRAP